MTRTPPSAAPRFPPTAASSPPTDADPSTASAPSIDADTSIDTDPSGPPRRPAVSRRLPALDVLRGIAILGTFLTNIWIFSSAAAGFASSDQARDVMERLRAGEDPEALRSAVEATGDFSR